MKPTLATMEHPHSRPPAGRIYATATAAQLTRFRLVLERIADEAPGTNPAVEAARVLGREIA